MSAGACLRPPPARGFLRRDMSVTARSVLLTVAVLLATTALPAQQAREGVRLDDPGASRSPDSLDLVLAGSTAGITLEEARLRAPGLEASMAGALELPLCLQEEEFLVHLGEEDDVVVHHANDAVHHLARARRPRQHPDQHGDQNHHRSQGAAHSLFSTVRTKTSR